MAEEDAHDSAKAPLQDSGSLPTPASFPAFPYPTPYSIQTDFMQQLYECIDQRKVGIFESPTGTGKSLSMICGAVAWLMDHERAEQDRARREQEAGEAEAGSVAVASTSATENKHSTDDTPDWVQQHRAISDATIERQDKDQRRAELDARVQKIREREKRMRENMAKKMKRQAAGAHSMHGAGGYRSASGQGKKMRGQDSDDDDLDDGEFLLDEYDSDSDIKGRGGSKGRIENDYGNLSKEVLELLRSVDAKETAHGARTNGFGAEDEDQEPDVLKLSQFIDELRKTSYGEHLHVVSLGSRKNLCINDRVRQSASHKSSHSAEPVINVTKLNDTCLDAQKSGTPSNKRCEFLHLPSPAFGRTKSKTGLGSGSGSDDDPFSAGNTTWWKDELSMTGDEKILEFRDHALARVRDIEELAELGSQLETCPYYGSRQTVRHCQLVTLPYNLLLHASTRESLKLAIKGNILLLDEAHNLINSLLQMHSVTLSLPHIVLAQEQLQVYLARYEKRLSSINEGHIRVIIRVLDCLEAFVEKWKTGSSLPSNNTSSVHSKQPADRVMKVNEFLHDAGMDHINLFKAHTYLDTSGVARKLQGFHESQQRKEAKRFAKEAEKAATGVRIHQGKRVFPRPAAMVAKQPSTTTMPVLLSVDAFLISLLNADNDGRVIVAMDEGGMDATDEGDEDEAREKERLGQQGFAPEGSARPKQRNPVLKFMLLNPANVFKPLIDEARSVILAGGTMEPVSDLLSLLFPYLKSDPPGLNLSTGSSVIRTAESATYPRIHRFSCGHVIPKENLMTLVMEKAATGTSLELNFANRNQDQVMDGIGQSLANLLNMIPDGVVVFFVSYSYMAQVLARWRHKVSSTGTSILERIQARKRVFIEPREAPDADRMLKEYHECIYEKPEHTLASAAAGPRGGVLFSVVGGKMSEGINFSDRLGRGVIVVGMPFPNRGSPELQERMRYMDQVQLSERQQRQPLPTGSSTPMRMTAGSEYYENLCMRAVNQSIGRAIRHQNDYAVVVLMDRRYGAPRIRKKLPGWIGSSIEVCDQFGPAMNKLANFFRAKRELATKTGNGGK
ncbi:DEAD H (Asp-Glu-Ala-Asp His) box helicase 11 [Mortierella alpina]|uniref:ATP-dependent DNA helicase CHL1 n=1 Tax=Mortierella alpina TaxID=64518 RepID=A0A9P6JDH5_MORAP|nr:DEAD H (Asp-Glu-Ala-Asp His) box helicase 11 [Mortierella alpina]